MLAVGATTGAKFTVVTVIVRVADAAMWPVASLVTYTDTTRLPPETRVRVLVYWREMRKELMVAAVNRVLEDGV